MMEGKKISFGFSKIIKKAPPVEVAEKKQFIDCLEGKSIKIVGGDVSDVKEPLVIPLKAKDRTTTAASLLKIAMEAESFDENPEQNGEPVTNVIEPSPLNGTETLEEIAARELIQEANKKKGTVAPVNSTLVVPAVQSTDLTGEKESTLDDYDNIPIADFGMAMLRGMGWAPGAGMGKHDKSIDVNLPKLRPKGMGLGADKIIIPPVTSDKVEEKKELPIINGSYIKIIAGKLNGTYGQVNGFDEDSGRVIIKTAIGGKNINVNEFTMKAITKDEYTKSSKVINSVKYEEYKNNDQMERSKKDRNKDDRHKNSSSRSHSEHSKSSEHRKSHSDSRHRERHNENSDRYSSKDRKREHTSSRHYDDDRKHRR